MRSDSEVERVIDVPGMTRRDFIAGTSAAGMTLLASASAAKADNPPPEEPGVKVTHREPSHVPIARPSCIAATSDGRVVTCDDKGGVYIRSIDPIGKNTELKAPGTEKAAYVAVSNDRVLTAFFDGTVTVHALSKPQPLAVFDKHRVQTGPKTEVWMVAVSSDASTAVSATNGGEIRYWNVGAANTIAVAESDGDAVGALAFLPGNKSFLSGNSHGGILLWNITAAGGLPDKPIEFPEVNASSVNSICVFKQKNVLKAMTGSFDGEVRVWDLSKLDAPPPAPQILPVRHKNLVWRVAASPDGTKFASAGEDATVRVYNATFGEIATFKESGGVMGVTFVDNNRIVFTNGSLNEPQIVVKNV
jgi:WD40 repeat protein